MNAKEIAALAIALAIAATLIGPFATAVAGHSGTVSVTNETVSAQVGQYVDLNGYQIQPGETVYWYNSSAGSYQTLASGTDYKIATKNGSIEALSGGTVNNGDTLKVTYDYAATSGATSTIVKLTPLFVALILMGVMAAKMQDMM